MCCRQCGSMACLSPLPSKYHSMTCGIDFICHTRCIALHCACCRMVTAWIDWFIHVLIEARCCFQVTRTHLHEYIDVASHVNFELVRSLLHRACTTHIVNKPCFCIYVYKRAGRRTTTTGQQINLTINQMITTVCTMKASSDATIKRTLVTDMWFKHLLHAKLKAFVTRSGYKSDSDELCVMLLCVLFILPSSR